MPSARLVFNDDATVLGPVLERTGEMIKAATSDIPRLRFAQEGLALDRERFGHTKAMDLAKLKMRQDAFQAEQDAALMGNLLGPGAAGSARTRSSAGSLSSANLPQMRFDYQQQRDAQRQGDARRKELEKGLQERRKYQAELEAAKSMSPISGQFIPKYSPEEIQKLVGIRYPQELDESDPALQLEAFSSYPESPFGARGDAPALVVDGGLLSMEPPSEQDDLLAQQQALDLQRKRAAFVRLKGDPALQQRMGIDEYRLNELYQQLWPQTGNTEETVGPIDFSAPGVVTGPQEEQVTDLLTLRAADAAHASRGRPPVEVSELPAEAPAAPVAAPRPPIDPRRMNDVRARAMSLLARNAVPDPYYANTRAHAAARYAAEKAGAPMKPLAPTPQEARAMIQELIEIAPPAKQVVLNAMLDKIDPNQTSPLQRFGNFVSGFDEMKILEQAFRSIFPDQSYAGYVSPTDLRIEREQVERYGRR